MLDETDETDGLDGCMEACAGDEKSKTPDGKRSSGKTPGGKAGMRRRIRSMVREATDRQLRDFVTAELARDDDLRLRFEAAVGETDLSGIYSKVMQMFKKAGDKRGWLDYGVHVRFGSLTRLAKSYEAKEKHAEAIAIYRGLSEAIGDNMGNVFECDGYYMYWFSTVVRRMASCMSRQKSQKERMDGIKYLAARYADDAIEYFEEEYEHALRTACTTKAEKEFCKSVIKKRPSRTRVR